MTSTRATHPTNNFDFIRIVAASMVLFSHHFALTAQGEPSFFGIFSLGGLAVAIFFIISGYLVMISWMRDPNLPRFAMRRFLRIWPALTCVLVLTAYVLGPIVTELPVKEYLRHGATFDYLRGVFMRIHFVLPGVFEHNPYARGVNGSLWTIPIEVLCYIVLGIAGLIGLLKFRSVFLLCVAVYLAWFLSKSNADVTGVTEYSRELGAYFLLGASMARLENSWQRYPLAWAAVIGVLFAALWANEWRHTALLAGLTFAVIYLGTRRTPILHRAGRFGDPSYGIYLYAFPVQQTAVLYLWPQAGFAGTMLVAAVITAALGLLSWHTIEKQALKFKPRSGAGSMFPKVKEFLLASEPRAFFSIFALLCVCYAAWLVACWPGMLGQDSLAVMLEIETNREFQANKPAFWYLFNLLLYGPTLRAEWPIAIQLLISALVCARVLSWMVTRRMFKSFAYCLLLVALAPTVLLYVGSMYSDGIYAIALSGMLFEVWLSMRSKSISRASTLVLLITVPFAIFARPNGVINLLPLLVLAWVLTGAQRARLALIAIPWCIVGFGSQMAYKYESGIGTVYPLSLYETVGFLEHRPMGLWEFNEPRVTQKTIDALTSSGQSLEKIQNFYDHYYWDPLIFFPQGPALGTLSKKAKSTIVKEFLKYNLWHNFPAFAASRVNIFLFSALARAAVPGPLNAMYIVPQTKSRSHVQTVNWPTDNLLIDWFHWTMKHRAVLWAPWLGLILIAVAARRGFVTRDKAVCAIGGIYVLQLLAVFMFSIAGEYRYLLAFFTAPLVLLPMLYYRPAQDHV
ncbi:acyltransferase [Diaphorobacter sp.]|uniref:acyltransferase family protein n=1 Tax=Diaphorobacter sp. TaxID=1934310 RepID=UPI0028AC98CA|nr:acyltransferase [Diaphorobacter sp.]